MDNPTLTIPKDVIGPLIQARVNEVVLEALGDKGAVLEQAVASVLNTKVNSDGKVDHYGRGEPWIEWAVGDRLRKAVEDAIVEALDKHEKAIKRMIVAELQKKNSPMIRQLVSGMVGSLGSIPSYRIAVSVSD